MFLQLASTMYLYTYKYIELPGPLKRKEKEKVVKNNPSVSKKQFLMRTNKRATVQKTT